MHLLTPTYALAQLLDRHLAPLVYSDWISPALTTEWSPSLAFPFHSRHPPFSRPSLFPVNDGEIIK